MTLGEKIKQAREEKNLSQEELAEKLGVSRQAVSKWENDNAIPQGMNRELISQVLDVDLSSLGTGYSAAEQYSPDKISRWNRVGWYAAASLMILLIVLVCVWFNDRRALSKNSEQPITTEWEKTNEDEIQYSIEPETLAEPGTIEGLTCGSRYEELSAFGEVKVITPVKDEAVVTNKGYFDVVEYEGLTATVSAGTDFILPENAAIYSLTIFSDAYTDSKGLKVGDSKEKLMREYNLYEHELISAGEYEEEYEELYRIQDDGIAVHELPAYDFFYPADKGNSPIILIYLIKDDCINGILLRNLTAD